VPQARPVISKSGVSLGLRKGSLPETFGNTYILGATNADEGATNAAVQRMRACNGCERGATNADGGATNATATGATDANGNECPKTGVRDLCLGARRAGDSTNEVAVAGSARRGS
jgi:hypothetical protein